jgi:hypothetical protein
MKSGHIGAAVNAGLGRVAEVGKTLTGSPIQPDIHLIDQGKLVTIQSNQ